MSRVVGLQHNDITWAHIWSTHTELSTMLSSFNIVSLDPEQMLWETQYGEQTAAQSGSVRCPAQLAWWLTYYLRLSSSCGHYSATWPDLPLETLSPTLSACCLREANLTPWPMSGCYLNGSISHFMSPGWNGLSQASETQLLDLPGNISKENASSLWLQVR